MSRKLPNKIPLRRGVLRCGRAFVSWIRERNDRFTMVPRKTWKKAALFFLKSNKAVRSYFEKTRCWILYEAVHSLSHKIGLTPHDVSLCDFKARWGSCDAEGRVKLNWRLAMLPPELCDYVIIHELCHLRELNHSAVFWRLVEKYCPSYREYRSRLRDFSFLTLMYRREKTQS